MTGQIHKVAKSFYVVGECTGEANGYRFQYETDWWLDFLGPRGKLLASIQFTPALMREMARVLVGQADRLEALDAQRAEAERR